MTKYELNAFVNELSELLAKYKVSIGAEITGDTHGVSQAFVVSDEHGNDHEIKEFESYVDVYDLNEYLKDHPIEEESDSQTYELTRAWGHRNAP